MMNYQFDDQFIVKVKSNLNTKIIGKNIYHFKNVNSTNSYAKKFVNKKNQEGTVIISDAQKKGRGRKNRHWSSPLGGLWFSIILYPDILPKNVMHITMTASISIVQAIRDTSNITPAIKWPNDLIINNKKICGVLTEIDSANNKINYVIVGIGINVNNKIEDALKDTATSLKFETSYHISKEKLLVSILNYFDKNYKDLLNKNFNLIKNSWLKYSNIIDKKIKVIGEKNKVIGFVINIDDFGHLILKTKDGFLRIVSGDVYYL